MSSITLDNVEQMRREWVAWQTVCDQLKSAALDINEEKALHASLMLWAENLSMLRATQPGYQDEALLKAVELYRRHVGTLPF